MSNKSKPAPRAPHRTPSGRASRAKIIEPDLNSKCFSDLAYSGGEVVATFARDGSTYTYPMSKREALEWFDDESAGQFFNAFVR